MAELAQMVRDEVSHKVVHDFIVACAGVWTQMLSSEFNKFQHEGGLTRIRAEALILPSVLFGRVVGVLKWLDVGVAPQRRVRHELDGVHDAGTSSHACFVNPVGLHNYYEVPETSAEIMNFFSFHSGAIMNDVGMLNCAMETPSSACVPNGPTMRIFLFSQVP